MADSLLGTVVDGRYRLVEILFDAGPRGVVFRAEHLRLTRQFAVKVFRDPADASFDVAARKLSCIQHPHIAAIHDYGRLDDGRPYVVTELLPGETLRERMESSPLRQLEVLDLIRRIAGAVAEVHRRELVHGGIKPENLFYETHESCETVKLLDFDLPTARKHSFIEETTLASADWISPEQAKGLSAEEASDVYALGAIAYACFAEHPPHAGDPHVVLSKKIDCDPPALRELPMPIDVDAEVDALIQSMLARAPCERPSASQVQERADWLYADLATPPLPQPIRSRVPWFGLAAALMGALALLAGELRMPGAPRPVVMPTTGSITLLSSPGGAEIYLDGEPLLTMDGEPAVTPADVQSLLFGKTYRVQLRKDGYVTWETEVGMNSIANGREYSPELAPLPAVLSITADPGSLIFVDELAVGRGRWLEETVTPLRPHLIRATSATAECDEKLVRPEPGTTTIVNLTCTPSHAQREGEHAVLTVTGDPHADVYLDHERIGSPPIVDMHLHPGGHRLTIKNASEVRTLMLDAAPGNSIRYHVD